MLPSFRTRGASSLAAFLLAGQMINAKAVDAATTPGALHATDIAASSDYAGPWQGTLSQPVPLRIQLLVSRTGQGAYNAILYNVDHAAQPLAMTEFLIAGDDFEFSIGAINTSFRGRLDKSGMRVSGTWTSNSKPQPLMLERVSQSTAWEIPKLPVRRHVRAANGDAQYEVATIRPSLGDQPGSGLRVRGRQLQAVNTSVIDLIEFAYGINKNQLADGPDWYGREKFDIDMLYDGDEYPGDPECKAMVRQVLAERFGLKTHLSSKVQDVYVLAIGKSGAKLTKSEGDPNGLPGLNLRAPGQLSVTNATMSDFVQTLQRNAVSRPVLDRTHLEGRFDFGLQWAPGVENTARESLPDEKGLPGLSTAIKEQLGLQLEPAKSSATVFVVDAVQRPSAN